MSLFFTHPLLRCGYVSAFCCPYIYIIQKQYVSIVVLDGGKIVEAGSWDELPGQGGFVAEPAERQKINISKKKRPQHVPDRIKG